MTSFSPNRLTRRSAGFQHGLSLIELMISITIGLIILTALTTMFVNQSRTRAELDKTGRLVENSSYALDVLAEDLRIAGFYGELDPPGDASIVTPPVGIIDPCSVDAAIIALALPLHVQGFNNATALPATCVVGGAVPAIVANTDILVVRRASTTPEPVGTRVAPLTPYLQASLCQFDNPVRFVLSTATGAFTLRTRVCTPAGGNIAPVRRFFVHIYFIALNNVGNDGIPTLKRLEIGNTGALTLTPLVEGVENMQIDYGLDNTAAFNGTVDAWTTCSGTSCTNAQWANVVSVRVHLLVRSLDTSAGYTDAKTYNLGLNPPVGPLGGAFKRRVYSQFIRLTNPAGRREGAT